MLNLIVDPSRTVSFTGRFSAGDDTLSPLRSSPSGSDAKTRMDFWLEESAMPLVTEAVGMSHDPEMIMQAAI
jgi:hypothetical protein